MFEQTFKNIDDKLWKDAGCSSELDYVEQTSWILFLKYLDDLEKDRKDTAELSGKKYTPIITGDFRWEKWAAPKTKEGKIHHHNAKTGDDLIEFVNNKLFPYLKKFKETADHADTIEYKIGEIFSELKNKLQSGYNLREVINLVDELRFRSSSEKHEMSALYEDKIKNMSNAGRNGGEYYTPRPLIKSIVKVVAPEIGDTIYDGALGEEYLRQFQDNERSIPTILTTSQKLSTGVDARNIRNIILMRPINSMIEFKQIIGRGTRLFDGKEYFTIYDFVDAHHHFADPEWDGEPEEPVEKLPRNINEPPQPYEPTEPVEPRVKVKVKLRDGKEREIQHMASTLFYSSDGRPISAEQFLQNLFGKLPEFFKNEDELRKIWSNPITRRAFLEKLAEAGFGKEELSVMQSLINAEKSDLFDVLEYISFAVQPITREKRVASAQSKIFLSLNNEQKQFVEFVLSKYIETGVEELDQEKLPELLKLRYMALDDAQRILGTVETIRNMFIGFQQYLYQQLVVAS